MRPCMAHAPPHGSRVDVDERSVEALVATILGGPKGPKTMKAAMAVAEELLAVCGGLAGLAKVDEDELTGLLTGGAPFRAEIAARALAAAFELGRRVTIAEATVPEFFGGSADAAAWAIPRLGSLSHEELWMVAVDGRSRLRATRRVAKGGLHGLGVKAADTLRLAIRSAASGFLLVHNHPSGDPTPSPQDVHFTREVAAAAATVGVPLLDHVVVTRDAFATVPFEGGGSA